MSTLSIFSESGEPIHVLKDFACIASTLSDLGIRFERWPVSNELEADADAESILYAYRHAVDLLSRRHDFKVIDVVDADSLPADQALHDEHVHCDFEILFFADGDGLFYFHVDQKVYLVMCEKGDLISLPPRIEHWLDMGGNPSFRCIRFFTHHEGLQSHGTDSNIASRFPSYEQLKQRLELAGATASLA